MILRITFRLEGLELILCSFQNHLMHYSRFSSLVLVHFHCYSLWIDILVVLKVLVEHLCV